MRRNISISIIFAVLAVAIVGAYAFIGTNTNAINNRLALAEKRIAEFETVEVITETSVSISSISTITKTTYVVNTSSNIFHKMTCGIGEHIKAANRYETTKSRDELIADGYKPCGNCCP